jgi:hypothetical protein
MMLMEFPKHPTKRQLRNQQRVSVVISGMQDILLEPSPERLDQLLETAYDLPAIDYEIGAVALRSIDINKL